MKKILLLLSMFLFVLVSCTNEVTVTDPPPADEPETQTGAKILDELRAQAIDEDDLTARILSSIKPIQEEFTRTSEANIDELGQLSVSIDADCNFRMVQKGKSNGETVINLAGLDPNGFSLIPDGTDGEYPGLRIATKDGEAAVEVYNNGDLVTKNNELVIFLVDRAGIERITPVLLQMMMICQGTI